VGEERPRRKGVVGTFKATSMPNDGRSLPSKRLVQNEREANAGLAKLLRNVVSGGRDVLVRQLVRVTSGGLGKSPIGAAPQSRHMCSRQASPPVTIRKFAGVKDVPGKFA
jgi:hypothetical protein